MNFTERQLTTREQQVLSAIVQRYVETAEPVGSKVLSEIYTLNASPATIRSVMHNLDRCGLLYQPHTSAGRVPSESGYRVYVDSLLPPLEGLKAELERFMLAQLPPSPSNEQLLEQVAQLLAKICGCIAIVTTPERTPDRVRQVQLVSLDAQKALLILVTSTLQTDSVPVEFNSEMGDLLEVLNNFLNAQLKNRYCNALLPINWADIRCQVEDHIRSLENSLEMLEKSFHQPSTVKVNGLKELLKQPEFSQAEQIQPIVELLEEEKETIVLMLQQKSSEPTVKIGKELGLPPVQKCSLIASGYRQGDAPGGWIGILGPTRLPYERGIAAVEVAAEILSTN
ncbi:MAG: heat-inducible transcriptional repressor HrcA [Pseudanabaenaceae cyanobacterium SKYGB_i_bin29]|nr:heat-inducible transcriptional repressor HrcA [Pseudanabaenaceae cyanobacterium SKYG29]MDW8422153.1 heat-inducible transcriptional repressor HrcA [Pseudanabaenaceae cyanobacterium SKYGB_i_bin29]